MNNSSIHLWAVVIFLVSSGVSPVHGSSLVHPPIIFLAGLTAAGMVACENLWRSRRAVRAVVVVYSRN